MYRYIEVDEAMFSKAIVAVEESRQVLNSVESSLQVLDERFKVNQGGGDSGVEVTYVRGGKTLAVDVDPDGIDIA